MSLTSDPPAWGLVLGGGASGVIWLGRPVALQYSSSIVLGDTETPLWENTHGLMCLGAQGKSTLPTGLGGSSGRHGWQ